jgi:hypothetical protein
MRDDFSREVKLALAHRAGMICSNPHCNASTSGPQDDEAKALNIGVAAHISAASPGGARYDETLTAEQRYSASNGLWLCQNCAKLVDNDETAYPAQVLRAWKTIREHEALRSIGQTSPRSQETERQRMVRKIVESKEKVVMLIQTVAGREAVMMGTSRPWAGIGVRIADCNEFFLIVKGDGFDRSIPMDKVRLGWDSQRDTLEILVEH